VGQSYDNPADASMPYLEQIPGTVSPYYQPYIDWGQQAGNTLATQYGQMANNPSDYYDQTMAGYTESPAYQYNYDQAMKQQQGAAAAGGYTGTYYDQNQQAKTSTGLLAQDQQQYYNNVTGAQRYGLQGESHLFDTGYNASNTLATMLGENLAAEAGLQYKGATWEDQMNAQKRNNRNSLYGMTIGAGAGYAGMNHGGSSNSSSPYISGYSPHY
jgi:hypothetical protein